MQGDGKLSSIKIGGNFGELAMQNLETRSCTHCARTFKVMHHSTQQECSNYCRHASGNTAKWQTWHRDAEYIENREKREKKK